MCLCFSDQQGGFELQSAEDVERQNRLLEELKRFHVTQQERERPKVSRAFSPLLDVPVDSCSQTDPLKPSRTSPVLPNWLLTENTSPATDTVTVISDEDVENANSKRWRFPFRNGLSETKASRRENEEQDVFFTVVDTPRPKRPLLSQVFGPLKRSQSAMEPPTGQRAQQQTEHHVQVQSDKEYELKTVTLSKTKQSLGKNILFISFCQNCQSDLHQ